MCGEKSCAQLSSRAALGSPPHVRGKGGDGNDRGLHARITPACAGKSLFDPMYQTHFRGSPPHVRGKAGQHRRAVHGRGITPACAGKSGVRKTVMLTGEDHPRMCGEKTL